MKLYQSLIEFAARFAVGLAMLVALACATVIVVSGTGTNVPAGARSADRVVDAAPAQPVLVGQFEPG